jgi:hypothetical protein
MLFWSKNTRADASHLLPKCGKDSGPHLYRGQSADEVFCRSAVTDQEINGNRLASPGSGSDRKLLADLGISSDKLKFTDLFREHAKGECKSYNKFLNDRQLSVSEKGYVGLGPSEACIGDEIVILPGRAVPYLLRLSVEHGKISQPSRARVLARPKATLRAVAEEPFYDFMGEW